MLTTSETSKRWFECWLQSVLRAPSTAGSVTWSPWLARAGCATVTNPYN